MTVATKEDFAKLSFEQKLDRFAEVAVTIGLNLQVGQELVITASIESLPLTRKVIEHAYKAGAKLVTAFYSDDPSTLARYKYAHDESFDYAPIWMADGIANAFRSGAARMAIAGGNPALLAGQDSSKISRASIAASKANKPAMELITKHMINWSIIAAATPDWAKLVFPNEPVETAVGKLWDAIFYCSRIVGDDPVATWKAHREDLQARVKHLNEKRYRSLYFKSADGKTDITVGLADNHVWGGGGAASGNGVYCNPNIPTEEVYTAPHKDRVDGIVSATKPLSHQGTLIENITCTFHAGKVVEATATKGEDVLKKLLATDDGASRLGEVALVPHSSPISQSGTLFWNTLFDENASSHIALGQSYATSIADGENKDAESLASLGANSSLIHVDWMIGSDKVDVTGITEEGDEEPLMHCGEWV